MRATFLGLCLLALVGCSDDGGGTTPEPDNNGIPEPELTTTTVGRDGGVVTLGEASLVIPPGSLLGEIEIGIEKLEPPPLDVLPGYRYVGDAYAFTPHGTQFIKPVIVKVPYTVAEEDRLAILRLDDEEDRSWDVLEGGEFRDNTASYQTQRLSIFVAAQEDPCTEDTAPTWYKDADGDGFGTDDDTEVSCTRPAGYAGKGGDCDDSSSRYNPGAVEDDCTDDVDYNCDGSSAFEDFDDDGTPACEDCNDQLADIGACPNGTTCVDGGCE